MTHPQLDVADLVRALTLFQEKRYHAVDVFADDLSDAAKRVVERGTYEQEGRAYRFGVFRELGVVRFEQASTSNAAAVAVAGALIGGAVSAAAKQKGDGILGGALLGLLVGGVLGSVDASNNAVRRVFALQFDPATREWTAYDGALLRWMKDRLLVPDSAA